MTARHILATDQGTSSSRAVLFDAELNIVDSAQQEFAQIYPQPGWVEHDPEAIWTSVAETVASVAQKSPPLAALGITNQRETTLIWERDTGRCIHNAIVWQDRRTAALCRELSAAGRDAEVIAATGLRLDPYFSATKVAWLLDHVSGARERAMNGELAFGTVDSYLIWRLTGGRVHATDATNASRTMLFNIHAQDWDDAMLELFDVPRALLPEVRDCNASFGESDVPFIPGPIPICGVAGDQQAALIGQAGFDSGMTKSTYGTGLFTIANTGATALASDNQLLTTVAMRIDGDVSFGLEGSVFVAGSAVQWLRDEMRLVESASDTEAIAEATGIVDDVVVVPAFAGLGAPWWDPAARGAVFGLTRGSNREHVVTATLQAIAYQTRDLVDAMADDGMAPSVMRVDGGMVANNWFLQFLADILDLPVERPVVIESTVLGAALLAARGAGLVTSLREVADAWQCDARFEPQLAAERRDALLAGWHSAVQRTRTPSGAGQ